MNSEGKTLVHQKQLKESGFNFNCFTDVYKAKNGNTYKLCYDVGYKELDLTKEVLIVDRQDYM